MKDNVLWILTYLDCVNRYATKVTNYNTYINRILDHYCNTHLCGRCAISLKKDLTCLAVFIREYFDSLYK